MTLEVYEEFIKRWTLSLSSTVGLYVAQNYDPPNITVKIVTPTQTIDDVLYPALPGRGITIRNDATYDLINSTLTLLATSNVDFLVPGMEIEIDSSNVDSLNTIWRLAEIGITDMGVTPLIINVLSVPEVIEVDLGLNVNVVASRTVSRQTFGTVVSGSLAVKIPYFAGMLYGTTDPQVYVDGTGVVPAGVYDIFVTSAAAGEFAFAVDLEDGQDVYVGTLTLGTFESMFVGFEINTSSDISGPNGADGHVQSGIGSQTQMDANIDDGYLSFAGGGYEYATYEFANAAVTSFDISGTFEIPLTGDVDFGLKWTDTAYHIKCLKKLNSIGVTITSNNGGIITNVLTFATDIQVTGSIQTTSFPIDITDVLATPNPQMSINAQHDKTSQTLVFTIVLQGGTRFGSSFAPQGPTYKAKVWVDYIPTISGIPRVTYYSNVATKLSDVILHTDPPTFDISTLEDYTVVYAQRSDTGLNTTYLLGPHAYDGHVHRGDGTLEALDIDIVNGILTFSADEYNAAEYTIGVLGTLLQAVVIFDWAYTQFGIEWLDSYTLTCDAGAGYFNIEVYHVLSNTILVSFTPAGMVGRVDASIVKYNTEGVEVVTIYPPDVASIDPQTVTLEINHDIKNKELTMIITINGTLGSIVYTLIIVDSPPVDRTSDVLSFVAYGAITAHDIEIFQRKYNEYPTFEDCIFLGSNFTVGGNFASKERANVFMAAIGDTRLFRGGTDEFEFFSNVVTANMVNLLGDTSGNATLTIHSTTGNALHAIGNVTIDGNTYSSGDISSGNNVIAYASDGRLKSNVTVVCNALNILKQLRGVTFDWREDTPQSMRGPDIGLIAQDLEHVGLGNVLLAPAPFDQVYGTSVSGHSYKTIHYNKLHAFHIEAIKELSESIDVLHARLALLESHSK